MTWDRDHEIRVRLAKYRMLRIQARSIQRRMELIQTQLLENDQELEKLEDPATTEESFRQFIIDRINSLHINYNE